MKRELLLYSIMALDTDHIDDIVEDIRLQNERGVSGCALFSMSLVAEGVPVADKVTPLCEKYRQFKKRLDALGLKSGVLVQSSLGHGYKLAHPSPYTKYRGIRELKDDPNVCCPSSDGIREYLYGIVRAIALEHPDMIMIDDDFRMIYYRMSGAARGNGCCCELHMKDFNEIAGANMTASELSHLILNGGEHCREYTDVFIDTQRRSLVGAAKAMRAAIDSVDPTIPASYCCCGPNGDFAIEIAKALRGEGNPSVVRWNNGVYLTSTGRERMTGAFQLAREQYEKLSTGVDVLLAETDTCPQNRHSTSAAVFHVHFTGSILEGAQGAKQWITKLNSHEPRSGRAYRDILSKNRGFYDTLLELVPSLGWRGARIPVTSTPNYDFTLKNGIVAINCWGTKVLERLALPMYYSSKGGGVAFLEAEQDKRFDDAQITEMLKGTAVLSSDSARSLAEKGFGEYIGVTARAWTGVMPKGEQLRESGKRLPAQPNVMELVLTSDEVEILSDVTTTNDGVTHTVLFPGVTKYKNSLGGTVYVFSGAPDEPFHFGAPFSYLCETRKEQFAEILAEAGELPMYSLEDSDVYLKCAEIDGVGYLAAVFNLGLDPIPTLEMRSGIAFSEVYRLSPDGKWQRVDAVFNGNEIEIFSPIAAFEPAIFRFN